MLTPRTLDVVMVSFEGPDVYSQAGGLGVRARELCRALAAQGFPTSLVFVGDPQRPATEVDQGVHLHRWAQHLSARTPSGVYEGEEAKVADLERWLPSYLAERLIIPAAKRGAVVAVLAEEWQTAGFALALDAMLRERRLRRHCAILWNANNTFGFERIDWGRLQAAATITTVSRYMKHLMWMRGVNPLVIPNGIPESALQEVPRSAVAAVRRAAESPCLAFKIGRFTPDKRWHQAMAAVAHLRAHGVDARLLIRGGIEPFGGRVLSHARALGLMVAPWAECVADARGVVKALTATEGAPVVDLRSFLPDAVIPVLYAAATGVLANSGHEPFGLVGLEAMAAGGVALVGATGEDYARSYANSIVVETDDAAELGSALGGLAANPALGARLRRAGRRDAREFTWARVIEGLLERLRYVCEHQQVAIPLSAAAGAGVSPVPAG